MIGMLDHEMHIERQFGLFAHKPNDGRAERNVVDEMAVHDVAMDPVGSGLFDLMDFLAQAGEVGGQDRGGDEHLGHGSIYIKSLTTRAAVSCYRVSAD